MPRPSKVDRPCRLTTVLPESVYAPMQLELYSEVEGRVPHGRISELLTRLVKDWLEKERGVQI